jgi:hypothetical protein
MQRCIGRVLGVSVPPLVAHDVGQVSLTVWPRTVGGPGLGRFPFSPKPPPSLFNLSHSLYFLPPPMHSAIDAACAAAMVRERAAEAVAVAEPFAMAW